MSNLLRKLPGYRKQDSKLKKIVASVIYGFLFLIIVALIVPSAPTIAIETPSPTRFAETDIKGKLSRSGKWVFLLQNEKIIAESKSVTGGEFSIHLSGLQEGKHAYKVEACDEQERKHCNSQLVEIVVDFTPPSTPIVNQVDGETQSEVLALTGTGESGSKIKVTQVDKEYETVVDPMGNWKHEVKLSEGQNNLQVIAEDEAGNQSTSNNQITVNYTPSVAGNQSETVKVTRVIDGDTIEIEGGQRVRYIGIDTPETVDPRTTVQCYGKEASAKNKELVEGKEVRLEKDVSETDKYQRLLRYIWIGDTLINEVLVREGYAYSSSYPPDVKYQDRFVAAQADARNNNRGLWGECNLTPTVKPTTKPITQQQVNPTTTTAPAAQPTSAPAQPTNPPSSGSFSCTVEKTCSQMISCEEAYYHLNVCGYIKRDGDKDGVPCESICPGG